MANDKTYYRGNVNLKNEGIDLEYTPEQIEEVIKCRSDFNYFMLNYIKIKTNKGLRLPDFREYQKRIAIKINSSNRLLISAGRQSGKTSIVAMYIVWYICFNETKTVGIVCNKETVAKEVLDRIKETFKNLPLFLKPGITQWNKKDIALDNGNRVIISACSSDALSGFTINFLYIDEVSKIPKNKVIEFFDSVLPTVAADENAKIICSSTPRGLNYWYKMWTEAEQGTSGYDYVRVEWNEVPFRDNDWRLKMIAEKGLEYFNQEYACHFIGSSGTLLSTTVLQTLAIRLPIRVELEGCLNIYFLPEKEHKYVAIVDVSEGLGKDYSTIQILDISCSPYIQVCVYRNNKIKPLFYHTVINNIAKQYNDALVIIENNSIGMEVLNNLNYDCEFSNIFYSENFGIKTTKKSKSLGCSNFSFLMENNNIIICDYNTIQELSRFVRNGNSYSAQDSGDTDDLVMPLIIFSYFLMNKNYADLWLEDIMINKEIELDEEYYSTFFSISDGINLDDD